MLPNDSPFLSIRRATRVDAANEYSEIGDLDLQSGEKKWENVDRVSVPS